MYVRVLNPHWWVCGATTAQVILRGAVLSRGQIILSSALLLLANHNKVTQTLAPCTLPVATGRNRYVLRRQKCDTGVMIVYMAFEHSEWFGWLPLRGPRRGVTTCRPPPFPCTTPAHAQHSKPASCLPRSLQFVYIDNKFVSFHHCANCN